MEEIPNTHEPGLSDTEYLNAHKSEDRMVPLGEILAGYGQNDRAQNIHPKSSMAKPKSPAIKSLYRRALLIGIILGVLASGALLAIYGP